MPNSFVFADEAGDFNFSRDPRASKFFIVCTVTMTSCHMAHELLTLKRDLAWKKELSAPCFHASEDKQSTRDAVFAVLQKHNFLVHATILEKSKAQPQVRVTEARFYHYGWYYLFKYGTAKALIHGAEVLVTAASVKTKGKQRFFSHAVNDVMQQTMRNTKWRAHFCPAAADPCLQVADYCTWAIQRKWERGDARSYDLIKRKIVYEYDLWARGTEHQY